jgi:hypothetical protein
VGSTGRVEKKEWRCCNKDEVVLDVAVADAAALRATKTAAEMDSGNMKEMCAWGARRM